MCTLLEFRSCTTDLLGHFWVTFVDKADCLEILLLLFWRFGDYPGVATGVTLHSNF